jgi:hypothetical protein
MWSVSRALKHTLGGGGGPGGGVLKNVTDLHKGEGGGPKLSNHLTRII